MVSSADEQEGLVFENQLQPGEQTVIAGLEVGESGWQVAGTGGDD